MLDFRLLLIVLLCFSCGDGSFKPPSENLPPNEKIPPTQSTQPPSEDPIELFRECSGNTWKVASFNLQSGDSDLDQLIRDMISLGDDVDIWALQEVDPEWFEPLVSALESWSKQELEAFISKSGGDDRLMVVYKSEAFDLDLVEELDYINIKGRVRSPLHLSLSSRISEDTLSVVNNHLYRGSSQGRHDQARLLNAWGVENQSKALILVGDYNFDYDIATSRRDRGFDLLTSNDVFRWVEPVDKIKTQCSSRYDSILDFVFLGGSALAWSSEASIELSQPEYCRRGGGGSDHRPVVARVESCKLLDPEQN